MFGPSTSDGLSGQLLQGVVTSFAFLNNGGAGSDAIQISFALPGGALVGNYPQPPSAGISILELPEGTLAGNFTQDFDYENAEGSLGSITTTTKSAPLQISTVASVTTTNVGTSIADQATVTGGTNPTGTVTFNLFSNPNGTGTPLFTDANEPLNASGIATSKGYTATTTGTDYWVATYNGDSKNAPVSSDPTSEPVSITPASPTINTTQQPATATVGASIADMATVSGGFNPTGTVTFYLYNNSTATGTPLFTDTESLSGGAATSAAYTATATGTDYWVATYNGDSNNSAVTSGAALEPVVLTPSTPTINTTQQPATATVGASIADMATVSGGFNPTGTVTFNLYDNPNGTGTPLFTDSETLVGGAATSKGYTATTTGTDYWVATYNGDTNNATVTSGTTLEPVVLTPSTPTINTTQQPATATVGASIADKATVSGGYNPTGTVTFKLYSNSTATGTPLFTDANEPLTLGVATSKGYTATTTGTDYWVATYNGDSNNTTVISGKCCSSPWFSLAACPAITTQASETNGGVVGTAVLKDSATITGGYNVSAGSITFTITPPTGPVITVGTVPVTHTGTFTSPTFTTTLVGTYLWHATYTGDALNNGAIDTGANESLTTTKAAPCLTTTASFSGGNVVGTAIPEDKAVLSGGYSISGGSLNFLLKAPGGAVVDNETITLKGQAPTTPATPTSPRWPALTHGPSPIPAMRLT